ncbi:TPA: hypothetical protein U3L52_000912 [Streptococcus agalactiae]|nr:hypothetical protein [Streptococcus agalactiae]HEM9626995.1 hypothetical protein [Streptococcus agalactiae]HEN0551048.1 hypothetical protein [Streptococcus agalactiae]HEN0565599.1 hypothetical protein [Streptococcus agalactiae]
MNQHSEARFGTIRNSTALKRITYFIVVIIGFGTIRNSTALKLLSTDIIYY